MDPKSQDSYTRAYNAWVLSRSNEDMANLVDAFMPTINAEIMQYSGPKELLRSRGRYIVTQAVKSFDPMSNVKLNSWVVTNLRQLSRYGKRLRPIRASEVAIRNAAELASVEKRLEDDLGRRPTDDEISDETGWNKKTLAEIRKAGIASVSTGSFEVDDEGEGTYDEPGLVVPNKMPYYAEAVYMGLNDRDKAIFDAKTGMHGKTEMPGSSIADMLKITPAAVSQRSSSIASDILNLTRR